MSIFKELSGVGSGGRFWESTEPSTFLCNFGYLHPFGVSLGRFGPLAAAENTIYCSVYTIRHTELH
mgnify:CR=1 FL=1